MIRYHGQAYEDSDDYANDLMAAEWRAKQGIKCENCSHWLDGRCSQLDMITESTSWCHRFNKK